MGILRIAVTVFLLAVITQTHGDKFANVVQKVINKQASSAFNLNLNITGRLLTPEEGCGIISKASIRRTISGVPAKRDQWPWAALLGEKSDGKTKLKCAGTLISSKHILTAARCKDEKINFVRLGEHNLAKDDDAFVDIEIERFVQHPEFNPDLPTNEINDIAIVHLKEDVKFSKHTRPVCIPTREPAKSRNFVNSNPFTIEYGIKSIEQRSDVMLQDQVTILSKEKCKAKFVESGVQRVEEQYSERVVCTGGESTSKCQYDLGSPLMMPVFENRKFSMYQIGVTAYGYNCLGERTPGISANVQYFADWIIEELKK